MGQGVSTGALVGFGSNIAVAGLLSTAYQRASLFAGCAGAGLAIDVLSDATARVGKCNVEREAVLNATDSLKHAYTFYVTNDAHPVSRMVYQKHEWLVLESHSYRFYTVQKWPGTGDVTMHCASSLRAANDWGLRAANRPTAGGETRQYRQDMDFDLPEDLQAAYVIAWLRKEDPRWAFSTENSKQFTMRLRYALHDF